MIPYGRQTISNDDIEAVKQALSSDYLTQGPIIQKFENQLAQYTGAKYAVVFNSGTAALHSSYFAAGLTKGDEFITSPITFVATANAGLYLGAKPIFCDVEENNGNIDATKIEKLITKKTKLIVPVHYSGYPANLETIYKIAKKHKLLVVEDACHALGAKYKNTKIGDCSYSDMTIFSFHPVKHITTGEGGVVTTNNRTFYEKMIMFRSHGITKKKILLINKQEGDWYYEMQYLGYNYRLTDIQAALGISQLKKLDEFIDKRRKVASIYDKVFQNNPYFDFLVEQKKYFSAYHLYPIFLKNNLVNKRKIFFEKLRKQGVGIQVHYIPVYFHPFYQKLGYKKGICPNAENFYQREISIPMYPSLTNEKIIYVINTLLKIFTKLL